MFRRLPIMPLLFAATLGLFSLTSVLLAQQPKPTTQSDVKPGDVERTQRENAKLYQRFADELLRLAQRWEKSDNPDEKERAKSLRNALKIADEKGVKNLFDGIVKGLANPNLTGGDFNNILGNDTKLIAALEEILRTLEADDGIENIKAKILELKKLKEEIEKIKRDQENVRARTENPRGDRENIANAQKDLAKRTDAASQKFPGDKDTPNGNPNAGGGKEDPKAEQKPEQKPGDASPESKPDTAEQKSNDKAGMGSPMAGMGDPKGGGEPKPSPMGGMNPGDNKPNPKDGMGAGEPKPGEPKPMGGNPEPKNPMNPMAGQQKPGDSKAQGDGKGEQKPQASQPGGEAKPMSGEPSPPMGGGQPSQSKPSQGGGMPMGGGGMPPMGGGPQQPKDDAQENVKQAVPDQQEAEQNIRKNDPNKASKNQDDAITKLEKAIAELEKRLKQLREKELEKLLANLEERVGRMLRMQQEVYDATKTIHETVVKNNNQKTELETRKAQSEADKEMAIVAEAEKCLKLMESEGSAVVFAGVLSEVRIDMVNVQKRLNEGRVEGRDGNSAKGTQLIEEQIIKRLTMMKEALKKAKQDLQDQQNKPSDPKDGNAKQPDKKLIDLINQLKLLKLEQELVNERTVSHAKDDPGEQAKDAQVQTELKQLSDRQKKLQDLLHKLATEANQ